MNQMLETKGHVFLLFKSRWNRKAATPEDGDLLLTTNLSEAFRVEKRRDGSLSRVRRPECLRIALGVLAESNRWMKENT